MKLEGVSYIFHLIFDYYPFPSLPEIKRNVHDSEKKMCPHCFMALKRVYCFPMQTLVFLHTITPLERPAGTTERTPKEKVFPPRERARLDD